MKMITPEELMNAIAHANKNAGSTPSPIWIDMMLGRLLKDDVARRILGTDVHGEPR